MSDETNKKSERSIVGLTVKEMTREEWDRIWPVGMYLEKLLLGTYHLPENGQTLNERRDIATALNELDLIKKGDPVSSSMVLLRYLTQYSWVTRDNLIQGSSSKTPLTKPNEAKMFRSVFLYNAKKLYFLPVK